MMETMKSGGGRREITLPADTLLHLLDDAGGADPERLRERGRATGRRLAERLAPPQEGAGGARSLPVAVFWKRVADLFASRGWGSLRHDAQVAGVGELVASDWIEADRPAAGGCDFTTGMIEGLLESVSGTHIEVEETECRAAGGRLCRFRFGSSAALAATRPAGQAATGA